MKPLIKFSKTGSMMALFLLCVTVASCNQDIAGTSDNNFRSAETINYSVEDDELCPAGTYSSDGTGPDCIAAPVGKYVPEAGAKTAIDCPLGRYQNEIGQDSCKLAEPGSFVNTEGAAQADLCPIGTFSNVSGAIECTACAVGETTEGIGDTFCIPIVNDPISKSDCKNGQWDEYGFKNQGQCIRFVNTGKDSRI